MVFCSPPDRVSITILPACMHILKVCTRVLQLSYFLRIIQNCHIWRVRLRDMVIHCSSFLHCVIFTRCS